MKMSISSMSNDDIRTESLDKYVEDDFLSSALRIGLIISAIFQVVCVAASVLLKPKGAADGVDEGQISEEQKSSCSRLQKLRKQEKKKRR